MVYVTHDQIEAMSLADQVILMRGGRIEQKSPPSGLYLEPATTFCARFIGTPPMNIVALDDGPSGAVIRGSSGPALFEAPGKGLLLGLRPEEISVGSGGVVPATVAAVEYHGADSILDCTVGSQMLQVRIEGVRRFSQGQQIRLGWHPEAMHVFEEETGLRRDLRPLPSDGFKKLNAAG
jgi:sn-glycerol 3-phosphate transport system ATP-binding protein